MDSGLLFYLQSDETQVLMDMVSLMFHSSDTTTFVLFYRESWSKDLTWLD